MECVPTMFLQTGHPEVLRRDVGRVEDRTIRVIVHRLRKDRGRTSDHPQQQTWDELIGSMRP